MLIEKKYQSTPAVPPTFGGLFDKASQHKYLAQALQQTHEREC
jgi:hypothetical protein